MTYEVDALYAEEAYEPSFIEADSLQSDSMEPLNTLEETQVEAFAEVEAEADATEMDMETKSEEAVEEESEADAEVEETMDVDADSEAVSFVEQVPATSTVAVAAAAPVVPAPVVGNTTGNVSTANVTFVPANTTSLYPTGPNPLDIPCGCYNGAWCQKNVCICSSAWAGQWCERPSPIALARQSELDRLAKLTLVIGKVTQQVNEIEASTGSADAVRRLIAEAARSEIVKLNVATAEREFHKALSNNDLLVAREQMDLVKQMDASRAQALEREFAVQEERISRQLSSSTPLVQTMKVPVMQGEKYNHVDVALAKEVRAASFHKAHKLIEDAKQQARQFNLDFGDPL